MLKAICFAVSFMGIMFSFSITVPLLLLSFAEGSSEKFYCAIGSAILFCIFAKILGWCDKDEKALGN